MSIIHANVNLQRNTLDLKQPRSGWRMEGSVSTSDSFKLLDAFVQAATFVIKQAHYNEDRLYNTVVEIRK